MIQINNEFQTWLQHHNLEVVGLRPLSGGSINIVAGIELSDNRHFVVKQNDSAPSDFFQAEDLGLKELREALHGSSSIQVPKVEAAGDSFLLLEDLGSGNPEDSYWTSLAAGLCELHSHEKPLFGFHSDNYCGLTPQANQQTENGYDFFAEHRLLSLTAICRDKQLLTSSQSKKIEQIANSLFNWLPKQSAVIIHGDLWTGNIHCTDSGRPALIDPSCYWGWAEADIAMTQLFGRLPEEFYRCYAEFTELEQGWQDRLALYNLYHLLNHLHLFGESYLTEIEATLKLYIGKR